MPSYIALLRKEAKSDFGVNFPDFPGCITAGSTLEEARILAKEALDAHVALMLEDGDPLPNPSTLDSIVADAENRDALPFLVDLSLPGKVVRINITVPQRDLDIIDAAARSVEQPRSTYLVSAALERAREFAPVRNASGKAVKVDQRKPAATSKGSHKGAATRARKR